jgi:hypothetical protein
MNSVLRLELSSSQKELVLEGLRYVRSSRKLGFRDPLAAPDEQREQDISTVQSLISRIIDQDHPKS